MSLYSAAAEPTSHAVRVVLAEKAVNVEIHFVSDHDRPEDLHTLNPYDSMILTPRGPRTWSCTSRRSSWSISTSGSRIHP